jgi:hypothetical protein
MTQCVVVDSCISEQNVSSFFEVKMAIITFEKPERFGSVGNACEFYFMLHLFINRQAGHVACMGERRVA